MLNTSLSQCPYGNWEKTAMSACSPSERFHCLKDEFERIGWLCADPIWIEKGRCPVYNSGAKKLDSISCNKGNCPSENYRSNYVYIKNGCRLNFNKTEQKNKTNSTVGTGNDVNKIMHMEYFAVAGVIFLLLLAAGILFFILRGRRHLHRNIHTSVIDEEGNGSLSLLVDPDTSNDTYSTAASYLASRKFVVLKGIQGCGKTYLATKLADNIGQISKNECQVKWIHDVLENEIPWLTSKELLVLDDIFYDLQSKDEIQATVKKVKELFDKVCSSKSFFVIVTIPSLLWKRHLDLFKDKRCFDDPVDLDILSKEERTEILNNYLSRSTIKEEGSAKKEDKLIMSDQVKSAVIAFEKCDYIGYPSCVAWICKIQNQFELDEADRFMKFPITSIRNEIQSLRDSENIKERKMFLTLTFIAFCDGKLKENEIDEHLLMKLASIVFPKDDSREFALQKNDQSLISLREKYIRKGSAGFYEFYLNVVRKIVFVIALKERNIKDVTGCISQDMLKRFVVERERKLPTDLAGEHSKMFIKL